MGQLKGRSSVLMIVVVVLAAGMFFFFRDYIPGSGDGPSSLKKPSAAIEMRVMGVQLDGTIRAKVEQSGRQADVGLSKFGSYDNVDLRLADVEAPDTVRDECWAEEGKEAIEDLVGSRIWVNPSYIKTERGGRFLVYAWNRDDVFVQEQLLLDGDATLFAGNVSSYAEDVLTAAEDEASAADRGLWKACGDA